MRQRPYIIFGSHLSFSATPGIGICKSVTFCLHIDVLESVVKKCLKGRKMSFNLKVATTPPGTRKDVKNYISPGKKHEHETKLRDSNSYFRKIQHGAIIWDWAKARFTSCVSRYR
jgi:hypothetical protein